MALEPFHFIQAHVIQNTLPNMLDILSSTAYETSASSYPKENVLRFLSHLIMMLNSIEELEISDSVIKIIRKYVDVLKSSGNGHLIAFFLRILPEEAQNEIYSNFLQDVEEDKKKYYDLGLEHGLDMDSIVTLTVESIFKRGCLEQYQYSDSEEPRLCNIYDEIPESDLVQIRALEWFELDNGYLYKSITYANYLARYLLLHGRVQSVHAIFKKNLPAISDPQDLPELKLAFLEYEPYHNFIDYLLLHENWKKSFNQNRPTETTLNITQSMIEKFGVIISGSVFGTLFEGNGEIFLNLRKIYIPEIFIIHCHILISTKDLIPRYFMKIV